MASGVPTWTTKELRLNDGHLQFAGMEGLPAPSIQHTDVDFQPTGHEGFEVPHFDIHHYYVTHEEHMAITGEEEHH